MSRHAPTTDERIALERIDAIRKRSYLVGLAFCGLVVMLQALPERYSSVAAVASVALVLCMVAVLAYRACFLRCPRCSGWIAIAKCPGCGLGLDEPRRSRS